VIEGMAVEMTKFTKTQMKKIRALMKKYKMLALTLQQEIYQYLLFMQILMIVNQILFQLLEKQNHGHLN